jgi:hypothetical protein
VKTNKDDAVLSSYFNKPTVMHRKWDSVVSNTVKMNSKGKRKTRNRMEEKL